MLVVDSAVMWPNGKIYFFSGGQYYRYDVASDRADPGYPRPIVGNWPGLPGHFQGAVAWPNGKAYFFDRDEYYRYDIATDRVDPGFPLPTRLNWKGILAGPQQDYGVNAAVIWPSGKAYFFQYDRYYRYDIATDRVDSGYPAPIAGNWPGLGIGGSINAV